MECGCAAPYIGPSVASSCGGGAFFLFMSLLENFVRGRCDLWEGCERVKHRNVPDNDYDFVVIGAGSGGSVIASRLSENPAWRVLLLEAGGDEPPASQIPAMVVSYWGDEHMDWNYATEPEPNACLGSPNHKCKWTRGKVMGGCSVHNGMMYMRGHERDYENWVQLGNTGWGWKDVLPYFKKSEDNKQIGTLVDSKYHGTGGPWTVEQFPHAPPLAYDIVKAAEEVGFGASNDLNGDKFTGFAVTQMNHRNGTRLSAARAFIRAARNRPNLHVMMNSTATKVLITKEPNLRRVYGVEFMHKGKKYTVGVKKEAILSGGAVNSPQLLLLSGVGPKDELRALNIPVVHDLPGVGKNLHNHVAYFVTYVLDKEPNYNDLDWANALDYILHRKGPMSSTGMSQVTGILNTKYADPSGTHPDLQMFFAGYLANCASSGEVNALGDPDKPDSPKHFSISPVVLHPKSRGTISLKSKNPLDPPLIKANYLTEPEDMATLIEGVRLAQKLATAPILKSKYGIRPDLTPEGDCDKKHPYDSDDYWDCAIRHGTGPENHQVGSCKMGPKSDPMAVVDPELQVHGINGLRVVDASVMPLVVSGNTAAPTMMIAERTNDFIRKRWGAGSPSTLGNRFGSGSSSSQKQQATTRRPYPRPPPPGSHNGPHGPHMPPWHPDFEHSPEFHHRHPHLPVPSPPEPYRAGRKMRSSWIAVAA